MPEPIVYHAEVDGNELFVERDSREGISRIVFGSQELDFNRSDTLESSIRAMTDRVQETRSILQDAMLTTGPVRRANPAERFLVRMLPTMIAPLDQAREKTYVLAHFFVHGYRAAELGQQLVGDAFLERTDRLITEFDRALSLSERLYEWYRSAVESYGSAPERNATIIR